MTFWKRRASLGLSAALLTSLIAGAAATSALAVAPAVSFTVTPASATVPADGTSTIVFTFAGYDTATYNVTIMTTAGRFTATSVGSGIVIGPSGTFATVTNPNDIAAGATLTLKAPAKPRSGTVTVWLAPVGGGAATIDSTTTVHFTPTATATRGDHGGRDKDRGKGHGARKVAFYADPAYTCATGAQPAAGAPTFGFAVLNTTGHKMLNVSVALKGVLPNATYDLWVNQDPGACPLSAPTKVGAVHTNALGNGNGHVRVALVTGAKNFWVSAVSGTSVLRTKAALLTIKGK